MESGARLPSHSSDPESLHRAHSLDTLHLWHVTQGDTHTHRQTSLYVASQNCAMYINVRLPLKLLLFAFTSWFNAAFLCHRQSFDNKTYRLIISLKIFINRVCIFVQRVALREQNLPQIHPSTHASMKHTPELEIWFSLFKGTSLWLKTKDNRYCYSLALRQHFMVNTS